MNSFEMYFNASSCLKKKISENDWEKHIKQSRGEYTNRMTVGTCGPKMEWYDIFWKDTKPREFNKDAAYCHTAQ